MEKAKILIIEDVPEMAELISLYVQKAGMEPLVFATGEEAFLALRGRAPEAVLLDLNLPGMSGMEFLKKFRASYKESIPIIIVSARDSDEDIITALDLGADEFVTKPFSPRVLIARLEANMRRLTKTEAAAEESIQFGDYTVFENSCVLKRGTVKVRLSAREFDVLDFLVRNPNENLSPERIFNAVWKVPFGDVTAVAVYIQRLRKKIEKDPQNPEYIKTIFRYGYRFVIPEDKEQKESQA
ncbi:MAG: response regulator transcription factor [Treponema sp.]|nr:response regulator transcription factor [Treponema sp.]